jgi:C_GCAxxG_C_C family probable redox protein
MAHG